MNLKQIVLGSLAGITLLASGCSSTIPQGIIRSGQEVLPGQELIAIPGGYYTSKHNYEILQKLATAKAIQDNHSLNSVFTSKQVPGFYTAFKQILESVDDGNRVIDNKETKTAKRWYGFVTIK